MFSLRAAGTQVQRWEDKTPTWQSQGTDTRIDMSDSKQDCDIRSDISKKMTMKSSQDYRDRTKAVLWRYAADQKG